MSELHLTVGLSSAFHQKLEAMARRKSTNTAELLKRCIALMDVMYHAEMADQRLALVNAKKEIVKEIVGI